MRILLGSGGIATDSRRETYRSMVGEHFSDCETVLFVPYASEDHDTYTSRMSGGRRPQSGDRCLERHGWRDFAYASSSTTSRLNCGTRVG